MVYKGRHQGQLVALKQLQPFGEGDNLGMQCFNREVTALRLCQHPHIVKLLGVVHRGPLAMIMELCHGGNLFELLHEKPQVKLCFSQQLTTVKQVASAMDYLHNLSPSLMHRDLKSLNLLLHTPINDANDEVEVKVCDFGLARWVQVQQEIHEKMDAATLRAIASESMFTMAVGTAQWTAPEVFVSGRYGLKADVYSFGCLLYEVFARRIPYGDVAPMEVLQMVMGAQRPSLDDLPEECSGPFRDLLLVCWAQSAGSRPSFKEIQRIFHSFGAPNPAPQQVEA